MPRFMYRLIAVSLAVLTPTAAFAAVDSGDTAWILTATALVLFMTLPGLALFYAGLVQSKCCFCADASFCCGVSDVCIMGCGRLFTGVFR